MHLYNCKLDGITYGRAHSNVSSVALDGLRERKEDLFRQGRHNVTRCRTLVFEAVLESLVHALERGESKYSKNRYKMYMYQY